MKEKNGKNKIQNETKVWVLQDWTSSASVNIGEIIDPQFLGLCKVLHLQSSPQVSPSLEAMHNLPSPLQALKPHQLKFQREKSN